MDFDEYLRLMRYNHVFWLFYVCGLYSDMTAMKNWSLKFYEINNRITK